MEDFNIESLRFLNKTKKFKEIKDLSPLTPMLQDIIFNVR